jgi:hypothetical protein
MILTTEGKTGLERKKVIAELFRLKVVEGEEVEYLTSNFGWRDTASCVGIKDDDCEYRLKEQPLVVWGLLYGGKIVFTATKRETLLISGYNGKPIKFERSLCGADYEVERNAEK